MASRVNPAGFEKSARVLPCESNKPQYGPNAKTPRSAQSDNPALIKSPFNVPTLATEAASIAQVQFQRVSPDVPALKK